MWLAYAVLLPQAQHIPRKRGLNFAITHHPHPSASADEHDEGDDVLVLRTAEVDLPRDAAALAIVRGRSHRQLFSFMQNDLLYIMPHPAPQRDRTTIAMIMRGNRSATDNIWPEAARGHLARGRISGQRLCDRPRTVSSKARGQILQFVWVYWRLQLIVLRVTDFFLDPCCWRGAQAPTDHLHEEPFFPLGVAAIGIVMNVCVPAVSHAPPLGVQAWATNLSPFVPPRWGLCICTTALG